MFRERAPVPKKFQDSPELEIGDELWFGAFWDLNSCRQIGWDLGPISWLVVQEYCRHLGLSTEQTEDMHYYIAELDEVYLGWRKSRQPPGKGSKHGGSWDVREKNT